MTDVFLGISFWKIPSPRIGDADTAKGRNVIRARCCFSCSRKSAHCENGCRPTHIWDTWAGICWLRLLPCSIAMIQARCCSSEHNLIKNWREKALGRLLAEFDRFTVVPRPSAQVASNASEALKADKRLDSVFSQFLWLLPHYEFQRIVRKHHGDYRISSRGPILA